MNKKLGLLVIRGSGETGFKRQELFFEKVYKKLEKSGIDTGLIQIEYIDWYSYLGAKQGTILERMENANIKLAGKAIRKLIITNIGDLINYGGIPNLPSENYTKTHQFVHEAILELKDKLEENAPVILVASSFGTQIMNNYIWDRQHPSSIDPMGATPFERLETMVGFFCLGSILPIFASSNNIDSLEPITFPSANMDTALKSKAVWECYYDKNDAMGYPLKTLNANYAASNIKDIQINVGNPLIFWNFISHFGYWKSRKLIKRISSYIEGLYSIL